MTDTKTCTRCGETKPLDEFRPRTDRAGNQVRSACRPCEQAAKPPPKPKPTNQPLSLVEPVKVYLREQLDLETRAEWQQHGACLGLDADLFFPERGQSTREAKAVCRTCPVQFVCLEYAIAHVEKFGIWGGLSERERRRIRNKRRLGVTA